MELINKKVIVLAVILSLFTSFFIYTYINNVTSEANPEDMVKIFTAAKTIQPRAVITDADLKETEIDKKYVLDGAFQNKAEIVGKRAKDAIIQGEQIVRQRLVDEGKMNMAYSIPEGKRAVSIDVNEASEVANFIKPGDFVDILATFEKEEVTQPAGKITYPKISKVILQNVLVLGIGQESAETKEEAKKELPKTVTLAVEVKDVEKLVFAAESAALRLALRPVGDEKIINSPGTIRKEITGEKGTIVLN